MKNSHDNHLVWKQTCLVFKIPSQMVYFLFIWDRIERKLQEWFHHLSSFPSLTSFSNTTTNEQWNNLQLFKFVKTESCIRGPTYLIDHCLWNIDMTIQHYQWIVLIYGYLYNRFNLYHNYILLILKWSCMASLHWLGKWLVL